MSDGHNAEEICTIAVVFMVHGVLVMPCMNINGGIMEMETGRCGC